MAHIGKRCMFQMLAVTVLVQELSPVTPAASTSSVQVGLGSRLHRNATVLSMEKGTRYLEISNLRCQLQLRNSNVGELIAPSPAAVNTINTVVGCRHPWRGHW
jgi:hypothetical protein